MILQEEIKFDQFDRLKTGWGTPVKMNEWETHMIWCPSQMYHGLEYMGHKFCIYCRWRHSDPWQCILEAEGFNYLFDWRMDLSQGKEFTKEDDPKEIQEYVLAEARKLLAKSYEEIKPYLPKNKW